MLDDIEGEIKDKEKFIFDQNERVKNMHEALNQLLEFKEVLQKGSKILHGLQNGLESSMRVPAGTGAGLN